MELDFALRCLQQVATVLSHRSRVDALVVVAAGAALVAGPLVSSCGGRSAPASVGAIRLVDIYKPEMLHGSVASSTPPRKTEWRFDRPSPAPPSKEFAATRGWEAGLNVSGLTIRDGVLRGSSSSEYPVITIERAQDLNSPDQFHSIEIRMKVSAGNTVSVGTRGPEPFMWPDIERRLKQNPFWMLARERWASAPLIPGGEVQTYTVRNNGPLPLARVGRIFIRPTDVAGATFEIESVRLITRKEYLETVPSGVGFQGLSEIYRQSLVSRAPEALTFEVAVPKRAWLDLSIGTIDDQPLTFKVSVNPDGSGADQVLREETITTPYRWRRTALELGRFSGQKVSLTLALIGEAGTIGLWGAPVIRTHVPPEASSGAACPQAVIWIHADTLRPDHLSLYGASRDTAPFLRKLAAEGVTFDRAMSQATWTHPSSASFLTSLYPTTNGVARDTDRLPASVMTIAEMYQSAGYATVSYSSVPWTGQTTNLHRGFEEVHESTSQNDRVYSSKTAREYVDRAIDWIETHKDVPFFMYLHVFDPHSPFEARRPYDLMWADPQKRDEHLKQRDVLRKTIKEPGMRHTGLATVEEMKQASIDPKTYLAYEKDWYDGSIRGLDAEVARLFERLRQSGLDERTAVVFMSDHGEEFHEHGRVWHGHSAYGELAHVPLVIRWRAGVARGTRVDEVVQLIDIMPTLLDFSGLPHPKGIQGQSLVPLLKMKAGTSASWKRRPATTEEQPRRLDTDAPDPKHERDSSWQSFAINDGEWKLIRHTIRPEGRPEYELFDAKRDLLDQRNVSAEHPDVVQRLAKTLDGWHEMALAARLKPDTEPMKGISSEQLQKLKSLGYVR